MDAYEATRIVFSRIQSLDPENASKIMGLLLIQDHGEKEMIRLAFGPEALVHSVVLKARKDLSLCSNNNSTPSTPSSPSPFFSRQNSSSSRMLSNLSPSSPSSWVPSNFSDLQNSSLDDLISPSPTTCTSASASYAAVTAINGFSHNGTNVNSSDHLIDDFQLQDQLSFLNDAPKNSDLYYPPPDPVSSPGSNSDGMLFPSYAANWAIANGNNHRRSSSVTDICVGGADPLGSSGLGWKPCLYFARGYCKNGTSCRFLHGLPDSGDAGALVGSPSKLDAMEQCQELLLRSKAQQQQQPQQLRLSTASQLMASASFPYTAGKCINFLLQQQQNDTQRAAAAALMLGDDMHKFGRPRIERNEFSSSGGGGIVNPGSRQIYLTFPADSTFREEDVSNYFSIYGPVQDVRIPYQQKRMFGFVTFVFPDTVKLILAKGNPHFVCDARVLVKPYKEKGKVPDKYRKQQQAAERGDFSGCSTPVAAIDSREPYDLQQLGGRTFNNTQDFLRRKLEEQADLQQAIELQSRRFLGLQLLDVKKHQHHHRNLSAGAVPIPSPTHNPYSPHINHSSIFSSSLTDPDRATSPPQGPQDQQQVLNVNKNQQEFNHHSDSGNESASIDDCGFHTSLEHNLPDSPFASPKKSDGDPPSSLSNSSIVAGEAVERSNTVSSSASSFLSSSSSNKTLVASSLLPATSTLDMASFKSCLLQVPRFSSGHGALGM